MHDLVATLQNHTVARLDLLDRTRVTIGRAPGNDLIIGVSAVSRTHAEATLKRLPTGEQRWIIRDLGSTHGLWLDGERVTIAELGEHNTVRIGPVALTLANSADRIGRELDHWLDTHEPADSRGLSHTEGLPAINIRNLQSANPDPAHA